MLARDRPRLLAQLLIEFEDGSTQLIATDPSWRTITGPILAADLISGEHYDARLELTGWDQPADRVRALCAGFDQHVVKPASAKVLLSVITSSLCSWRTGGAIGRDPAVG